MKRTGPHRTLCRIREGTVGKHGGYQYSTVTFAHLGVAVGQDRSPTDDYVTWVTAFLNLFPKDSPRPSPPATPSSEIWVARWSRRKFPRIQILQEGLEADPTLFREKSPRTGRVRGPLRKGGMSTGFRDVRPLILSPEPRKARGQRTLRKRGD